MKTGPTPVLRRTRSVTSNSESGEARCGNCWTECRSPRPGSSPRRRDRSRGSSPRPLIRRSLATPLAGLLSPRSSFGSSGGGADVVPPRDVEQPPISSRAKRERNRRTAAARTRRVRLRSAGRTLNRIGERPSASDNQSAREARTRIARRLRLVVVCIVWTTTLRPTMLFAPSRSVTVSSVTSSVALPDASASSIGMSPPWCTPDDGLPCGVFVGLKCPPALAASGALQSLFSWMWKPCRPGASPLTFASTRTRSPLGVKLTVPAARLPAVGASVADRPCGNKAVDAHPATSAAETSPVARYA